MNEGQAVKVLVTGGRDYNDEHRVACVLKAVHAKYPVSAVIQGGARGADELAKRWAQANDIPCEQYSADWDKHGKSAGHIRNAEMLKEGKPDCVVAFPGGRGTAGMVAIAKRAGVPVWEIEALNPGKGLPEALHRTLERASTTTSIKPCTNFSLI